MAQTKARKPLTKYQLAYETLRERIVSGKFRPGQRIVISRVAAELEMSEIPVREAVKRLESDGLVYHDPYVGPVVVVPSNKEVADVLELLAYLEGLATKMAAPHLTEEHYERLERLIEEMEEALDRRDSARYKELNDEFHNTIYEATPNRALVQVIDSLVDRSERLWAGEPKRQLLFADEQHARQSLRDHKQILEVLRVNDFEAIEVLVRNHKRAANRSMLKWLATWNRSE